VSNDGEDGTPWPRESRPAALALQSGENQPSAIMHLQRPDGTVMWLTVTAAPLIRPGETKPYAAVATFSDITEHRALEDRLRQAYKLEAVGQLAGGIAHDFNNVLTAIRGAGEFLADIIPAGAAGYEDISIIQRATDRAAWLTRQLLSFGQRQVLQSRLTDLNAIVHEQEAEIAATA
jgi:signal transduction histidine kinase